MSNSEKLALSLFLMWHLVGSQSYGQGAKPTTGPPEASTSTRARGAEKSTHHSFSELRAGGIKTDKGWNVKDFAVAVMNPNSQEITITWKLISDDPKFIFRDGSIGTWSQDFKIGPMRGMTYNVYAPENYAGLRSQEIGGRGERRDFQIVGPVNFTGRAEFSSALPFYVFSGHEFETRDVTSADRASAWFEGWSVWRGTLPSVWDAGLQQFVIPYTNFWHNVEDWPTGWNSTLILRNNGNRSVLYTIEHRPIYGALANPKFHCQIMKYEDQIVEVSLNKGEELNTTLEKLFGWPEDQASAMEGIILIRPTPTEAGKETTVKSSVVPNIAGARVCRGTTFYAGGFLPGKRSYYFYPSVRAGATKVDRGWNVKDFAVAVMNPNPQEITLTWKLISDDPKFVFRDGSVGTWERAHKVRPMAGRTFNVYGPYTPEVYARTDPNNSVAHFAVSRLTNFTGSAEVSSSHPFYFYSGQQMEIPETDSIDPDSGWYSAWKAWANSVPAVWDPDLEQFVIPYTNYFRNTREWPTGWGSTLSLRNNTGQAITYALKHIPSYGAVKDPQSACSATEYREQTVEITLKKGQTLDTTLKSLFGWPEDKASEMEGILLIRPNPVTGATGTVVTSSVVPNSSGSALCPEGVPIPDLERK